MKKIFTRLWIIRITTFIWAVLFVSYVRYALDTLYPFWSENVSLSFFAFVIFFIIWSSFALFFFIKDQKLPYKLLFYLFSLGVIALFMYKILLLGSQTFLYRSPFIFTIFLFLFLFLFVSRLPCFIIHRVSLVAGAIAGIKLPVLLNDPLILFIIGSVFIFIPRKYLFSPAKKSSGIQRMLPLRYNLDLFRYFLLGLSIFGIFDLYRDRFYPVIFIIATAPMLQFIMYRLNRKKYHIRYGLLILPVFIIVLFAGYAYLPFSYWAAAGYSLLSIWETLYFNKETEGHLNRDIVFSGTTLTVIILFYLITPDWLIIISGFFIVLLLAHIVYYFYTKYNAKLALSVLIPLLIWSGGVLQKYSESYKRNFFLEPADTLSSGVSLKWFPYFWEKPSPVFTNIIPQKMILKTKYPGVFKNINYYPFQSLFFTLKVNNDFSNKSSIKNATIIVNIDRSKPYLSSFGIKTLLDFFKEKNLRNIFLYSEGIDNTSRDFLSPLSLPKTLDIPESLKEPFYNFAIELADYYTANGKYKYALSLYMELLDVYNTKNLLKQIADINGILGNLNEQIYFLEQQLSFPDSVAARKVLMELYFYKDNFEKSAEMAEALLQLDSENSITYYEWYFRILKRSGSKYEWQTLYERVKRYQPDELQHRNTIRKDALLLDIKETIAANPGYNEILQKEKDRQENILFPE